MRNSSRNSSETALRPPAGELVYARVHAKGAGGKSVSDDFTPEQMREEGVETTKNWFYKARRAIRAQFGRNSTQFGAIL